MSNSPIFLEDSITETQTVRFILDGSERLEALTRVNLSRYQKGIVFCDSGIQKLWWPVLRSVLERLIPLANVDFLEPSEATKHLQMYPTLVERLASVKCSRDDLVIVIGGGAVLDAISYLASTYMRGIPLMMIPTTLIGQADASTAGKTCINTHYAKNVLGTLYLPKLVYNNVTLLRTNHPFQQRQGFSEIFKYALLGSPQLLEWLQQYCKAPSESLLLDILKETIAIRLHTRKRDPMASNLGHTFGHALETLSHFAVNHGDAIAAGIVLAMEFGVQEGLMTPECKERLVGYMEELGLNTCIEEGIDPEQLTRLMLNDKKSSNTVIRLVMIHDVNWRVETEGSPFYPVAPEKVTRFLKNFMKEKRFVRAGHWKQLRPS